MRSIYLISYHGINISHVKRIYKNNNKKNKRIIYPTTYFIPSLAEHRIG